MHFAILDELETYGPDRCLKLDYERASAYTRRLAKDHYENFTVVSWLLPRRLRDHFRHVYAFCRWADDLGDEIGDRDRGLELLAWWRREIDDCYADRPRHPVFVALHRTIRQFDIPRKPLDDLVSAFIQDQKVRRYQTWDQILDYCTRSANPVGRLVLYLCGYRDAARQQLADATCTGLQLANFWQDVRRDALERDRVYIPEHVALQHGLDIELMVSTLRASAAVDEPCGPCCCHTDHCEAAGLRAIRPAFVATLKDLVDRTWPLFERGRHLAPMLSRDVATDVKLFGAGGETILKLIQRQGFDTLTHRPALGKPTKLWLLMRAAAGRLIAPPGGSAP